MVHWRIPLWLRGGLLILSLVGIGLLLKNAGFEQLFERAWIDRHVRGHGIQGHLLFLLAGAVATAIGLPRQAVAFFSGYAFGIVTGTLLGTLAALFGCAMSFYYARLFGRALVRRLFPQRLQRFDAFVRGAPFVMTLLVRLLPVGSNLATNLVAGVSRIPRLTFFSASFLGYLPQNLVFALAGSGLTVDSTWQIALSIVLFVVSGLLGLGLYRRMSHRQGGPESIPVP